ncbi:MAG: HEAT repeat domain-containing protein [Verrucomicrobiota bacterium]|nr:HEAT repeat domain-containing protein [Verrucomicrobiota bacterium]
MINAIDDDDPVIRYWSLTGIGNIGVAKGGALELSMKAMKDKSPSVRIAAARAVARMGEADAALEVLKEELRSEHQWGRLAAAIVIDEMEEPGRKIVKDLKEVLSTRQPNKYILRVANRALNDLLGTENKVP